MLGLQSHLPVTGVLKWEILESALGSAPESALGNRGAPGGCSQECSGKLGVLQEVLPRVLFLLTPTETLTLQSLLFRFPCFFFVFRFSLLFLAFFLPFPRILEVPRRKKNPCFFLEKPLLFPKKQGLEGQGRSLSGALPGAP